MCETFCHALTLHHLQHRHLDSEFSKSPPSHKASTACILPCDVLSEKDRSVRVKPRYAKLGVRRTCVMLVEVPATVGQVKAQLDGVAAGNRPLTAAPLLQSHVFGPFY